MILQLQRVQDSPCPFGGRSFGADRPGSRSASEMMPRSPSASMGSWQFSSTVIVGHSWRFWKVRAIPRRARSWGLSRVMGLSA